MYSGLCRIALDRDFWCCCCGGEHTYFDAAQIVAAVVMMVGPDKEWMLWIWLKVSPKLMVLLQYEHSALFIKPPATAGKRF